MEAAAGLIHEASAQEPWGGPGGSPFYDGRGNIVEIGVTYTNSYVTKLQITYAESTGVRGQRPTHGLDGGQFQKVIIEASASSN